MTRKPQRYIGQITAYGVFLLVIGYFATAPTYSPIADDEAVIKLSFSHYGELVSECRKRTPEELAELPPNMRSPLECTRERSPVVVQLQLDEQTLYDAVLRPTGLSRDGASYAYERFIVPSGQYMLYARLRDDGRAEGFNYRAQRAVELHAAEVLVVEFDTATSGFVFH